MGICQYSVMEENMADVTVQRTGELLRKLFEIILKNPDGIRAQDALKALRESVVLTEYEKGEYASDCDHR